VPVSIAANQGTEHQTAQTSRWQEWHSYLPHGAAGLIGFQQVAGQIQERHAKQKLKPRPTTADSDSYMPDVTSWHGPYGSFSFVWSLHREDFGTLTTKGSSFNYIRVTQVLQGYVFLILLRLEDHHRMLTTDLTNHSCTVAAAAPIGTDRRCCHNCSCKLELLLCFHMPSTLYYFLRKKNVRDCCGKVWPVVPSVRCGRHEL
jgi:hypothetical protein